MLRRSLSRQQINALKGILNLHHHIPYSFTVHWCVAENCELHCEYCPYTHLHQKVQNLDFNAVLNAFTGAEGVGHFSICGYGEPFLVPNLLEVISKICRKHYVSLVTNLVSDKIGEFAKTVDPRKVIGILASLHIKELEKRSLMDTFIHHARLLIKSGFNVRTVEVAYPPLIPEVDQYKFNLAQRGICLEFEEFNGMFDGRKYPESYSNNERKIFGLISQKESEKQRFQKGLSCNAGFNSFFVDVRGDVFRCFQIPEKLGTIFNEYDFPKEMTICPLNVCNCAINYMDFPLFKKALVQSQKRD